jgi:hypothetical protein
MFIFHLLVHPCEGWNPCPVIGDGEGVCGVEVLRGQVDVTSPRAFDASTDIALAATGKDLVVFIPVP